ncbi:MAG TPA: hypothetical protein VHE34_05210 [Puia sp.]|uniref:hypothetical protein n=1 Tax=Puia sp. TaxID=2045100 RepID=UPI002CEBF105|nr:hypothetical protein [Puia sp.]HVU94599.1 hypothetical protein [Puia sp.]
MSLPIQEMSLSAMSGEGIKTGCADHVHGPAQQDQFLTAVEVIAGEGVRPTEYSCNGGEVVNG